jgi:hypothetical protein
MYRPNAFQEVGDQVGEPLRVSFRPAHLDGDALSLEVPQVPEAGAKGLCGWLPQRLSCRQDNSHARGLPRPLRAPEHGRDEHAERPGQRAQQEAAAVHAGTIGAVISQVKLTAGPRSAAASGPPRPSTPSASPPSTNANDSSGNGRLAMTVRRHGS